METDTNANANEDHFAGLSIDLAFELIEGVFALGRRGTPSRVHVHQGHVMVASHDQEAYDHDGFPEVYLAGEAVTKSEFRKGAECLVADLREYPGTVSVKATQRLAGISLADENLATAKFLYHLRLEDPIKLLSREAKWTTTEGRKHLQTTVENLIYDDLKSALTDNVQQLWSHRDIREVSRLIFTRLDQTLRAWGIRLDSPVLEEHRAYLESPVPAYRAYPQLLYEVVLQFKAAERDLLEAEGAERSTLLEGLGLESADLLEIQNISAQVGGQGAGLFSVAKGRARQADRFIEWLGSAEQSALAGANFLKEMRSPKYTARELELTEQVVLSAFRGPLLGLGERRGYEGRTIATSQFGRLEARFRTTSRETD